MGSEHAKNTLCTVLCTLRRTYGKASCDDPRTEPAETVVAWERRRLSLNNGNFMLANFDDLVWFYNAKIFSNVLHSILFYEN